MQGWGPRTLLPTGGLGSLRPGGILGNEMTMLTPFLLCTFSWRGLIVRTLLELKPLLRRFSLPLLFGRLRGCIVPHLGLARLGALRSDLGIGLAECPFDIGATSLGIRLRARPSFVELLRPMLRHPLRRHRIGQVHLIDLDRNLRLRRRT